MTADVRSQRTGRSLLSRVNWKRLAGVTRRELLSREIHAPVVSTYRWWARRPHTVMGAILDAAVSKYGSGITVADPFSGGGTVTFEAARRGLKVYAQDLYPWPTRGLVSALRSCDSRLFADSAQAVLSALAPLRAAYRNRAGAELSHILRVRSARCMHCSREFYQFPHPMISVASRRATERRAYFGCFRCGSTSIRARSVANFHCDGCGTRWNATERLLGCARCESKSFAPTGWHAVLVQELINEKGRWRTLLRAVEGNDPTEAQSASRGAVALIEPIPTGKETKRLLDNQLLRWGDLYTQRQADVLTKALLTIKQLDTPDSVKDRLAFGALGAAEMPAFLSRWDRFNLKSFESMANHRYTQTTLTVEANLLSPVGRGTLPRRLDAAATALKWLDDARSTPLEVVSTIPGRPGRRRTRWDVLVATGNSAKQALRDASVRVVLTDPPYFDDVQYGELARLFHTWLKVYDADLKFEELHEAVPNSVRGTSSADYENIIAACLRESRRTLTADGILILTFHNKKLEAWRALAGALYKGGFRVKALAVARSENPADHCKRDVNAMLNDLVLECTPVTDSPAPPTKLDCKPRTLEERNLAAVGLALANCARTGRPAQLRTLYMRNLSRWTRAGCLIE
jgi:putative DNA methylase